jgi:hypothetical protein
MAGDVKLAEDKYQNKMQFGHVKMSSLGQVTTAAIWDATSDRHVRISPEAGEAFVHIGTEVTPTNGATGFHVTSTEYFIVRAGEYIGSSAVLNVIELGET